MDLQPGLFGLLGPNGAGKSTLMRTLATLQEPDDGTITLNGTDITKDPNVMRSRLGYLPQDFGVYPRMSAMALLNHIGVLKGLTDKSAREGQIETLLKMVNLWTHRMVSVSTYSGGMRQRFGVAQAMLGDPGILIVDEPTAGLDPFERQRFLDILSRAGDEKIIILSTHIVEDVRDLCEDMAIMGEGRIVARGEPEALINAIRGQVWRKRLEDDTDVQRWEASDSVLSTRRQRGATVVSVLSGSAPEPGFEAADPNLEDAYFAHLNGMVAAGERHAA